MEYFRVVWAKIGRFFDNDLRVPPIVARRMYTYVGEADDSPDRAACVGLLPHSKRAIFNFHGIEVCWFVCLYREEL